jgi:hypothetical protein
MNISLVIDEDDQEWALLGKILDIISARRVKQELAKQGLEPVEKAGAMLRIVLIAMFFSVELSYVLAELERKKELRAFAHLGELPRAPQLYRFLSRFDEAQFIGFVSGVLNAICTKKGRGGAIVIDSTDLMVDVNWFRRKITKADLEERDYDWGYAPSKGFYAGYKLTLAIKYPSLKPLAFLLHRGSPNDTKHFKGILEELKRRRIARNGDTIVCDNGYYAYKNYLAALSGFKLIPVIFPEKTFDEGRLKGLLSYPLTVFRESGKEDEMEFFRRLVRRLLFKLANWETYRPIRALIENIFKLAKEAFSLKKLRRYSGRSAKKIVGMNVLLVGVVAALGIRSKDDLERLAAW